MTMAARKSARRRRFGSAVKLLGAAAGVAAGAYAAYVAMAWRRYGHPSMPASDEADAQLDRFMPVYDVVDRHHERIEASAGVTLEAAKEMEVFNVPLVHAIFAMRGLLLGSSRERWKPRGLLEETRALGWVILHELPDREIVMGAVTRPWEADVTFRSIAPERFAAFAEPGYVKIVWTLRADPLGEDASMFRTETRAVATDALARRKFRRYWAFLSPGIVLIRRLLLRPLRSDAERRASRADIASAL